MPRLFRPGHSVEEHAFVRGWLPLQMLGGTIDHSALIERNERHLLGNDFMDLSIQREAFFLVERLPRFLQKFFRLRV